MEKYDTHVGNRFVDENIFLRAAQQNAALPSFNAIRERLPQPAWVNHDAVIHCYWKAWEIAFRNLRKPQPKSGFVSNYIDTAFNDCLFMWDSVFILMFGRYGNRAFNFQQTLDNFYALQHKDGFICREINEETGAERFERFDPVSTGPNVMPWAEWEYYLNFGDKERLARVFPCLAAYYQWFRSYRTWPDGTYWSSGWGCGMDNQPRLQDVSYHEAFSHGYMSWIDATIQQVLAGQQLMLMSEVLGRQAEIQDIAAEVETLKAFINQHLWDDGQAFYFDRWRNGQLSGVKSVAAFWALLAGIVSPGRLPRFIAHLRNPNEFNRPHRIPTLSADHPAYAALGGYWKGSVWSPTNYMILRGLTEVSEDDLAHEIAFNHLENVVKVFQKTGTLWENYAPENAMPGDSAKKDFVGWTGLSAIAVLLEYVFGIRTHVPRQSILWDVRLLEAHGVKRYPYGATEIIDLHCAQRQSQTEEPLIAASSNVPVRLMIRWAGGSKILQLGGDG